jgi:Tol biopolymer transport system component
MNQLPSISDDGRFVAFVTGNALDPNDNNNYNDVYVRDTCMFGTLSGCTPTTFLGSATDNPTVNNGVSNVPGSGGADHPSISGNGRFVAFSTDASDMVSNDVNGNADIFVRDTCFGAAAGCAPSTFIASVSTAGLQDMTSGSFAASISDDGRFVTFTSDNLIPNDANGFTDVYVRDTCIANTLAGCATSTVEVSVAANGSAANQTASFPKISRDGHSAAFSSAASNVVNGDNNAVSDVFLTATSF